MRQVEEISQIEMDADECKPYPRIVEGTVDNEHYQCNESEIIKRREMKSEFCKLIS
jgi:hypothetical protein